MANVKINKGYFYKEGKRGDKVSIESLPDALKEQANCQPCGCDNCLGYTTHVNAETGELMIKWISGTGTQGDPFVENIDTYDDGLVTIKALYAARV